MAYTLFNDSSNYILLRDEEVELTSADYKTFRKVWKDFNSKELKANSKVLLINDADQLFYNTISVPVVATIVDPDCYNLCEPAFSKAFNTRPFVNSVDSLGYSHKLTLLDTTFKDAFEDESFKSTYDQIYLKIKTAEEITPIFVERLYTLLKVGGILHISLDTAIKLFKEVSTLLEHYFEILSQKLRMWATATKTTMLSSYVKM